MPHPLRRVAPLTLAALVIAAAPASAAPDRSLATPLGVDNATYTWSGKGDAGANASYLANSGNCSRAGADTMCDETLVRLADDFKATKDTALKFMIGSYTVPVSDYDIRVYESDAKGAMKAQPVTSPTSETYVPAGAPKELATFPGDAESITLTGTTLKKGKFYLVQVVYFAAVGGYTGSITLTKAEKEAPVPGPATR